MDSNVSLGLPIDGSTWLNQTDWEDDLQALKVGITCLVGAVVSLITITGNLLVIVSFKLEKKLHTVSNYYLLSLAISDLIVGFVSIPFYVMFLAVGRWPLGSLTCDLWLSIDFSVSHVTNNHLLIICIDRYYSVAQPLTYMVKRTPKQASFMIIGAWIVSFLVWTPLILLWPYIDGSESGNMARGDNCSVPYLYPGLDFKKQIAVVSTSVIGFYLPVVVMVVLYFKIYLITKRRKRILQDLQAVAGAAKKLSSLSRLHRSSLPGKSTHLSSRHNSLPLRLYGKSDTGTTDHVISGREQHNFLVGSDCPITPDQLDKCKEFTFSSNEHDITETESDSSLLNETSTVENNKISNKNNVKESDHNRRRWLLSKEQQRHLSSLLSEQKILDQKQDGKAAKTLSAILIVFIVTWSPHITFAIVNSFKVDAVRGILYKTGYWLCYLNSTINPACYALCNPTFRKTFSRIMKCGAGRKQIKRSK